MLLDAQTFKTVLTPESALGIIQKVLQKKGYREYDVTDIRLIYTPYYLFSFDVVAKEGEGSSGRTALNAYTGDLNDFVLYLMDRPLKKERNVDDKAEVEPTAVPEKSAREVCAGKLAGHVGLKKDSISIGALSKVYIPVYRVWVQVADDDRKVEVDALVGAPTGLDDLQSRAKDWNASLAEVLEKMKTPKGWGELVGSVGSLFSPTGSPIVRYGVPVLVILLLILLIAGRGGFLGASDLKCSLDEQFMSEKQLFGFGAQEVVPALGANNSFYVRGTCYFWNRGKEEVPIVVARTLVKRGENILAMNTTAARSLPPGEMPREERFEMYWQEKTLAPVQFAFEKGI
ncbi:hypothetical protein HZC09_07050 [Candidatus Micrarchaeota archaeon]|nr:hypothetical protein [Candidatus Micrarchaeota archaeon]